MFSRRKYEDLGALCQYADLGQGTENLSINEHSVEGKSYYYRENNFDHINSLKRCQESSVHTFRTLVLEW